MVFITRQQFRCRMATVIAIIVAIARSTTTAQYPYLVLGAQAQTYRLKREQQTLQLTEQPN